MKEKSESQLQAIIHLNYCRLPALNRHTMYSTSYCHFKSKNKISKAQIKINNQQKNESARLFI